MSSPRWPSVHPVHRDLCSRDHNRLAGQYRWRTSRHRPTGTQLARRILLVWPTRQQQRGSRIRSAPTSPDHRRSCCRPRIHLSRSRPGRAGAIQTGVEGLLSCRAPDDNSTGLSSAFLFLRIPQHRQDNVSLGRRCPHQRPAPPICPHDTTANEPIFAHKRRNPSDGIAFLAPRLLLSC